MYTFERIDSNRNGFLSLAELDKTIVELYPNMNNKLAIMRAYKASDKNGDGFVRQSEFEQFLRFLIYYDSLWQDFSKGDQDQDRRLTKDEFKSLAKKVQLEKPKAAFEELDQNGGGVILFDEFCSWMSKHKSEWGVEKHDYSETTGSAAASTLIPEGATCDPDRSVVIETVSAIEVPASLMQIEVPPKEAAMALFERYDYNGNGYLSLAELDKSVMELYPELNHKAAIMRAYKASDKNGDGFVRQSEFESFIRFLVYYNNLWHEFSEGDEDGDRRMSKDEFVTIAGKMEIGSPESVFDEMDENGGGVILFDEFCSWMSKHKSEWGVENSNDSNDTALTMVPVPGGDM